MRRNHEGPEAPARLRCAIYTRKSTEEGLDQEFNSLDAQREAAEAFIQSQRREGWIALPELYDDGAQYATPRLLLRGVRLPRSPSSRLYAHSVSPVTASIATAARCIPAEKNSFPLTASGRHFPVEVWTRPEVFRFPTPGYLELPHIRCVNLVQRRILGAAWISTN